MSDQPYTPEEQPLIERFNKLGERLGAVYASVGGDHPQGITEYGLVMEEMYQLWPQLPKGWFEEQLKRKRLERSH